MFLRLFAVSLIVLLAASLGAFSATNCNSWWGDETCLTVHPNFDLGVIDSSSFHGATPQGGGVFYPISSLDNAIDVVRDGWLNLNWTLEVKAGPTSGIDRSRLYWRRSNAGSGYRAFGDLGDWAQVATGMGTTGIASIPIDYEYLPSTADSPGDYTITLTYRVTMTWGSYQLYAVSQDVSLYLQVKDWIVLALHGPIDLGTIDGSGYVIGSGLPPRDALGNGVFIVSNSPTGCDISLQVGPISTPSRYHGDLLSVFFWQIDGSAFHCASGLDSQPVIVATSAGPGKVKHKVGYRYTPTTEECGGDYSMTLVYTASAR
ncbi:MAG: hypothetical protein U9Q94_00370 [Candidatus Bipolaricaulota bacterium]|nr:hypothetical protein [Candidatus Bipolaricaulota bacterium]